MTMRKWLLILTSLLVWACVGQKDDPEPEPQPDFPELPGGVLEGTRFFHRILALEFTGTWCQYCPNMTDALAEAQQQRPHRLVDIAVHAYDEFAPSCTENLVSQFSVTGFPTMVLDMDASTAFNTQQASIMTEYVDKTAPQKACGLALSCADGVLTVKVKAAEEGEHLLSIAVVEDGQIAYQTGYGDNYVNHSVLCRFLSRMEGDSLGSMNTGAEATLSYEVTLGRNQRVIAYVTREGKCINALSCQDKETIPYTYEEDD